MQTMPIRIFFALFLLVLTCPFTLTASELRTALVIGNGAYSSGPLKNPVNDATDMAAALKKAGFTVSLKKNAKLQEMEEAIEGFGNSLKRGGVGLFYFAGHGVQVNGVNYLLPIGAKINKESDVKYQAVDANRILDEMASANNGLNIVLLDACRDNPFAKSFRSASRGLAIVSSAPTGTFISYSTGPGQVARDGEGRNSPYTGALLHYMREPGIPITDMFMKVRQKLRRETGQVPWELSSLEGKFFFVSGKSGLADGTAVLERKTAADNELQAERAKLEAERTNLQKEKELLEQRKVLEEERQKLETEKKQMASIKPPIPAMSKELRRDGRFIAYDNGTVLDTKTNLMWAAKDNGYMIKWSDAKKYCEAYRGGGYTDWRMPTADELAGLYDQSKNQKDESRPEPGNGVHLNDLIDLTHSVIWASDKRGVDEVAYFNFSYGSKMWWHEHSRNDAHAIPVRSVSKQSAANEIGRDSSFISHGDGTVTDTKTGLMWAAKGNKSSLDWESAKAYCDNYRGGGYTDWRMPTQSELAGLYEPERAIRWKVTPLIDVPDECWANETRSIEAAYFAFLNGGRGWRHHNLFKIGALPVRSLIAKKESRFIDHGNGTITDTKTGLMWAARDNGESIHWPKAKKYCEDFFLGGYRDWRLPTTAELAGLYDNNKRYKALGRFPVNLTELIGISDCSTWTSDSRGAESADFDFCNGKQGWWDRNYFVKPVLPVRSAK